MADENTAKATGVLAWLCWVVLVPSVLVAGYTAFLLRPKGATCGSPSGCSGTCWRRRRWSGQGALAFAACCAGTGSAGVGMLARTLVVAVMLHLAITGLDLGGATSHAVPRSPPG